MRLYELMLILDVSLPEDERREIVNKVEHELVDLEGEIESSTQFDVRDMAFPIKDVSRGDYRLITCKLEPSRGQELQERLNMRDDLVRYLLVNVEGERNQEEEEEEEQEESEEPAETSETATA